ncbi:DUF6368 family protein [Streptomyces anulatus]
MVPWLGTFCDSVESKAGGDVDFRVRDGSACWPSVRPASACSSCPRTRRCLPRTRRCLPRTRTTQPSRVHRCRGRAMVGAGRAGSVNHVLLGRPTPALARRLDALVDFDGLLGSRRAAGDEGGPGRGEFMGVSLPGRLTEVSIYDIGDGGLWLRHVGDVESLEAWLYHPDFHLIK